MTPATVQMYIDTCKPDKLISEARQIELVNMAADSPFNAVRLAIRETWAAVVCKTVIPPITTPAIEEEGEIS